MSFDPQFSAPRFLDLASAAKSDKETGRLRQLAVLDWIHRFRFSSGTALSALLSPAAAKDGDYNSRIARRLISSLIKKGAVKAIPAFEGRLAHIYILTRDGLQMLGMASSRDLSGYPRNAASIPTRVVVHNTAVQLAVLRLLRSGYTEFASEKELGRRAQRGRKLPDALVRNNAGEVVCVEAELTFKKRRALHVAFAEHEQALALKHYRRVLYCGSNKSLLRSLQSVVDAGAVQDYRYNRISKRWEEREGGKVPLTQQAYTIRFLPEIEMITGRVYA